LISSLLHTSRILGEESSGGGGISALGVDFKALILQILTFLIVFWILKKFAFDKIVTTLDERRNKINEGVSLGLEMEKARDKLDDELRERLAKARREADGIIAGARQEAGEVLKAAEEAASRKTDAMIADAHARIEDDIKRARKGLEHDMLALVADATEAVTDEKLDDKKDNSLIRRTLERIRS
jgi:F-type H+-transporting ATPase subunit b